ncbi:MAG: extracellular elastinolytic metalloproteinase, partial [Bacteroidia bacterium]
MKALFVSRIYLLLVSALILQLLPQNSYAQSEANTQVQSIIDAYLKQNTSEARSQNLGEVEWKLSNSYFDKSAGLSYAYAQQTYKGVPLFKSISVFAIKDEKVVYGQPKLVANVSAKIGSVTPSLNPKSAVEATLRHLKLDDSRLSPIEGSKKNHFLFDANDISASPIDVYLTLVPINEELKLSWNISIEMKNEPHWWNVRIDAQSGEFLEKNDFTVECDFSQGQFHNHSTSEEAACTADLTHFPSSPAPPSLTYNVYPMPVEAPTFGSRTLLSDPADYTSSPFGWHDMDGVSGAEYTIARGNNIYTYEDADNDNIPGYSPDGGASLNFDFTITPDVSPIVNQDAALTNMFVQTNVVHDILYHLGFDEAAGNFQKNNYGNGGAENDVILGEGFDGSGMNNANFSTPPDGSSPRMQMYLWNKVPPGCTSLDITSAPYTGPMSVGTAEFTASGSVTADLILADDGIGTTSDACSAIINNVTGKIAVIDRGTCSFVSKTQSAETAGAVCVIIVNDQIGPAHNMSGGPIVGIPCLSVSQADGDILKSALLAGNVQGSLVACASDTFDCNFDNGILVHEFGHGVSNRLTGGPSQASCLTNVEQASEGWSDWLALMLTIEPGDLGTDSRGVGSYVLNQLSTGGGIRRFPYSTDMAVNPQTYGDLATSVGLHDKGEIWCDAIWDMSWLLMDQFGINNDPTVGTAGNNIAIQLVLTGMKLQPCSPGFIDSRDGILAADILLYSGAHQALIWQAFARRGMGCGASQGNAGAVGDETEAFDEPDLYFLDSDEDGFGDLANTQVACSQPTGYVTNSEDCDDDDDQLGSCIVWTGATDSAWNVATNWSGNVVPLMADNVRISSEPTNQPHITSEPASPAECAALIIQSGATLTINSGKALTVSGNTENEGTILIEADASGIGSFIDNGTISGAGSFQMEQYIVGSGGASPDGVFSYVSSPITNATSSVYNAGGDDRMWSANESTQAYDEITADGVSMSVGQGYVVRIGATNTVTFDGSNYNTAIPSNASLTRTGVSEINRGYNLMGNPYPSSVDWETATRTNLESTVWYRTKNGSTMLVDTYNATTDLGTNNNGGGAVTSHIPPTQAFWVRVDADGNTGTLGFTNSDRSHQESALLRIATPMGLIRLSISHGGISDEHIILFDDEASETYDDYDSGKLFAGTQPYLYSTVEGEHLTMNGVNNPIATPFIYLTYVAPTSGEYSINRLEITTDGIPVTLEDHLLGTFTDLQTNPAYIFNSEAGTFVDRFTLHFTELITELAKTNG